MNNAVSASENLRDSTAPETKRAESAQRLRCELERLQTLCQEVGALANGAESRSNACLNEIANLVIAEAAARRPDIGYRLEFAKLGPCVSCSPPYLVFAFRLIVQNAEEAMGSSGTLVTTTALHPPSIEFQDNGPGMNEEVRRRAFEWGFSTKPSSGTGLPVVRMIVEHFGGRVELRSIEGKGTSVLLTWPPDHSAAPAVPPSNITEEK